MAVQTQTGIAAIILPAFKCVSLTLLALTLFYSVYLNIQPGVQPFVAHEHETVFTFLLLWIRNCHKKVAKLGNWFTLHAIQELGAGSPYLLTDSMDHTKTLVARASDIDNSPLGYAQPSFPFNILPGRVETRCQNYSGYALERCKVDVKTRTQLFITLMVIFSLVILCIVLITILTCMRRIKARRTAKPAKLPTRKSKRQPRATFITASKRPLVLGRNLTEKPSRRGIDVRQSLDGDEAVEADERGIDDQDIPVTMDGMTDGWMQWIRQRANMQQIPGSASPREAHDRPSPLRPPTVAPDASSAPAPRIPSLKLPRPTLSTFRRARGLEPGPPALSSQSLRGTGKGKGKEKLRVRWDGSV